MDSTTRTACTSRRRSRAGGAVAAAGLLALVAGCGSGSAAPAPVAHPTGESRITAKAGERFTLTVHENASTREHWYLSAPRPDTAVVRDRGQHSASDSGDKHLVGGGSSLTFTFEATGRGSTRIVLTHCTFATTCGDGDGTPAPASTAPYRESAPERVVYTVTVR
ncbi:protease inhibitor I42 family protein [Streptomyces monashensis]|uniref:protease inhibitor I42 family protein n=1 Tax=Streptomyces monashensis TaxID=1678012 RepID=UPI0009A0E24A|nr:protease inhibitor I42 family protein [Streptomyces monashensis]